MIDIRVTKRINMKGKMENSFFSNLVIYMAKSSSVTSRCTSKHKALNYLRLCLQFLQQTPCCHGSKAVLLKKKKKLKKTN